MSMDLLEREQFLCVLDALLNQTVTKHGQIAVVTGEAGIGKTTLVERFIERLRPEPRVLWGACESMFTPRPLGPLYDIAQQTHTPLRELLDGEANRATLFAALLDDLSQGSAPTVVVFEDIHWADEASLDLIKYLARRIHRLPTLLILTYRDDELKRDHPLRLLLGDLSNRAVSRLRLTPLSEGAVETLAKKAGRSGHELYTITGGNPFFINEALASDTVGVPPSVADAVMAKVVRRSLAARNLLELLAVVPKKLASAVAETAIDDYDAGLEECLAAGILQLDGSAVRYRHELARQAVESALTPLRRRALHAAVLQMLLDRGIEQTSLAQLVHHATYAENDAYVQEFAPRAARQASEQGAHHEAAAYYATALRYADRLSAERRAELLNGLSYERYLIGHITDAIASCDSAVAIWRTIDRKERVGDGLRLLSHLYWTLGRNAEAEHYGLAAVEELEKIPPSRELAKAYGNMSGLRMVVSDTAQTLVWGMRALELAERLQDNETVSSAFNTMGASQFCSGDDRGLAKLERSLQLAREHGFEDHVARAYANLADTRVKRREYVLAMGYVQEGMAYSAEHDLDSWGHFLRGLRAQARLDQGDWVGADEDATTTLSVPALTAVNRFSSLVALSLLRVRRGDPGARETLDEARDLALLTGEMQCIAPAAAARAEWRWMQGDFEQCVTEALVGVQIAMQCERPWYLGEVAIWLWRGGGLKEPLKDIPAPYAFQIAGDWRAAAALWGQMDCPYEQALALLNGDESALRCALTIFERLGATPAADLVRRRLRMAGVRGIPRGPRQATQANPRGLTNRQAEVLRLVAEGLRNTEIAERLSTTPKTVEHHVSAVLAKLEVRSRAEAAHIAYQLGLTPHESFT